MKVKFGIKTTSDVRKMGNCPKGTEGQCGIMYRQV